MKRLVAFLNWLLVAGTEIGKASAQTDSRGRYCVRCAVSGKAPLTIWANSSTHADEIAFQITQTFNTTTKVFYNGKPALTFYATYEEAVADEF